MTDHHPLTQAIIDGERVRAAELTHALLAAGEAPAAIIETRLVPGMAVVGEAFSNGDFFVPEMLIAARAMKASLEILEPLLAQSGFKAAHTAVIGTVEGDLHDIGKNLVAMMWKGANIEVIDLGVNVSAAQFVAAIEEHKPDLVGLSALLTTTMPRMRGVVAAIKESGASARVVVGGAPVTPEFASEIGADGFAPDAGSAADVALALLRA
jgi:5-methyltetrahydrofolate--homocysteine methyltransferase